MPVSQIAAIRGEAVSGKGQRPIERFRCLLSSWVEFVLSVLLQPKERVKVKLIVVDVDANAIGEGARPKAIRKLDVVLLGGRVDRRQVEVTRVTQQSGGGAAAPAAHPKTIAGCTVIMMVTTASK